MTTLQLETKGEGHLKSTINLITKEVRLFLSSYTTHNLGSVWPSPAPPKTKHNRQLYHPSTHANKHVPTDRCRRWVCIKAQQHHASAGCPHCWSTWLWGRACQILRHLAKPTLATLATQQLYRRIPWNHRTMWITFRSVRAAYLSAQINPWQTKGADGWSDHLAPIAVAARGSQQSPMPRQHLLWLSPHPSTP